MLRYSGSGDEYYKVHSDFMHGHLELPCGPRLFTLFVYLTDVPQGNGGHTFFPMQAPMTESGTACPRTQIQWEEIRDVDEYECGLLVRPQRGNAILWPNTDPADLSRRNPSTVHMALPLHGCDDCVKWAANVWIHLFDFKAAHAKGLGG
jgi:prolyl 4-hydroxylase